MELLGLLKASWSGLGSLLGRPRRPLWNSWSCLAGLLGALGRVLGALEAVLEALEGQNLPKTETRRVPNRVPEATRAEHGETMLFDDSI